MGFWRSKRFFRSKIDLNNQRPLAWNEKRRKKLWLVDFSRSTLMNKEKNTVSHNFSWWSQLFFCTFYTDEESLPVSVHWGLKNNLYFLNNLDAVFWKQTPLGLRKANATPCHLTRPHTHTFLYEEGLCESGCFKSDWNSLFITRTVGSSLSLSLGLGKHKKIKSQCRKNVCIFFDTRKE